MSNEDFIARLNDDVLLEIFLRVCSEKPQNAYPKYPYSALQLSLVCSRWRAVLLSSPRLWTNITLICCSIKASRDSEHGLAEHAHHAMVQEEITSLYVQRSRGWLISIFVCKSTKSLRSTNPPPSIRMFPISDRQIDLLCQAIGWKEISFLSTGHSRHGEARSWRCLLEKGASSSCCKTLDTVVLSENSTKLHNSPAFSLASNLHNLYVHGIDCCGGLVYESSQSDFPFNKIRLLAFNSFPTRGKIEADGLHETHSALRCFPYLRDLIVTVPHISSSDVLIPSMISFLYLTSLNLWADYTNQGKVKSFLFNISSPCLRSFALKYRDDIVQHPLAEESVISFLSTCSRSLRSFTLEKVPIRPSTLISILSVVPGNTPRAPRSRAGKLHPVLSCVPGAGHLYGDQSHVPCGSRGGGVDLAKRGYRGKARKGTDGNGRDAQSVRQAEGGDNRSTQSIRRIKCGYQSSTGGIETGLTDGRRRNGTS